jgi:hypothetical protein
MNMPQNCLSQSCAAIIYWIIPPGVLTFRRGHHVKYRRQRALFCLCVYIYMWLCVRSSQVGLFPLIDSDYFGRLGVLKASWWHRANLTSRSSFTNAIKIWFVQRLLPQSICRKSNFHWNLELIQPHSLEWKFVIMGRISKQLMYYLDKKIWLFASPVFI